MVRSENLSQKIGQPLGFPKLQPLICLASRDSNGGFELPKRRHRHAAESRKNELAWLFQDLSRPNFADTDRVAIFVNPTTC